MRRTFFGLLVIALSACSALPALQMPAQAPPRIELEQVPFLPQQQKQCGAASLAAVLAYRGKPVAVESLAEALFIPEKQGTLAIELAAQARSYGLLAYPLEPTLEALFAEVAAGNPVLVLQNQGLRWLPQYHFAVLVGYDVRRSELILRSGKFRRKVVALKTFNATWRRAGAWALAIVSPDGPPVTAVSAKFLQAAADLEQLGQLDAAEQGYLAAARHWPEDGAALAALGLANIAYARGNFSRARDWLVASLATDPLTADNWNNLAYILIKLQCFGAAEKAVQCASSLQPQSEIYRESEREIRDFSDGLPLISDQPLCAIPRCPVSDVTD